MKRSLLAPLALLTLFSAAIPADAAPPEFDVTVQYGRESVEVSGKLPEIKGDSVVARFAQDDLQKFVLGKVTDMVHDDLNRGPLRRRRQAIPHVLSLRPAVTLANPKLVSVFFTGTETGPDPHPQTCYISKTYGLVNGKPRELALKDLFVAGTNPYAILTPPAMIRLKAQGASGVASGRVRTLDSSRIAAWVIEPEGILLMFTPGEVVSYAEGPTQILIGFDELARSLNVHGPLRSVLQEPAAPASNPTSNH